MESLGYFRLLIMFPARTTEDKERDPQSAEVSEPALERSEALPEADRLVRYSGRQDLSAEINGRQLRLQERLSELSGVAPPHGLNKEEVQAASAVITDKVNFLQGEIAELRKKAELLSLLDVPGSESWLEIEGAANRAEQQLLELLENSQGSDLTGASRHLSNEADGILVGLTFAERKFEQILPAPSTDTAEAPEIDPAAAAAELGVPLSGGDLATTLALTRQRREALQDRTSLLGERLAFAQSSLERSIEILALQTGEHENGLAAALFSDRYELEEEGDRTQVEQILRTRARVGLLEQELVGARSDIHRLDLFLDLGEAKLAADSGRPVLAAMRLVGLTEDPLASEILSAEREGSVISTAIRDSLRFLVAEGTIEDKEAARIESTGAGTLTPLAAELNGRAEEVGAGLDILEQVDNRETVVTLDRGRLAGFVDSRPALRGKIELGLSGLEYRSLEFGNRGASEEPTTLIFKPEASAAWDEIPEGSQPVLLRQRESLRFGSRSTGGGRVRRTRLSVLNLEEATVELRDVGYVKDGKLYNAFGESVDLDQHPAAPWISEQIDSARSFGVRPYRPRLPLRLWEGGSGEQVAVREELFSIRTQSGAVVSGVGLSPEAREALDRTPPEGMTLVLRRRPEGIELGAEHRELIRTNSRGRSSYRRWQEVSKEVDEVSLADLAYASVRDGTLRTLEVAPAETLARTETPVSVAQSAGVPASRLLGGKPSYDGRSQAWLSHLTARRLEFRGGSQDERAYTLLFDSPAEATWDGLPADAQPVLLRPVEGISFTDTRTTSGRSRARRGSVTIHNPPSDFVIQSHEIGYAREGSVFTADGKEVGLDRHQHADWIRGQIEHGAGLRLRPLNTQSILAPDGSQFRERLFRLQTHAGERVEGVTLSEEALAFLSEPRPFGTSVVLNRHVGSIALSREFDRQGESYRQLRREPVRIELADLSLSVRNPEGFSVTPAGERTLSLSESDALRVADASRTLPRELLRSVASDPDIAFMHSAALSTNRTLRTLQQSLEAHGAGSSREAFVEFVRSEARPLQEFLDSTETEARVERLEARLAELKTLQVGVAGSEAEQIIVQQIQAIESFISVVRDPRVRNLVETLLDESKFSEDSWSHWSQTELPIIAGAVAGAVAGTALIIGTAGAAGVAVVPLWAAAAGGAAGTVAGMELAREGVHLYHNQIGLAADGETTFGARSILGTKLSATAVFNPETGEYEQLTWGEVSSELGVEFLQSYALNFGTMLGSRALAGQFSRLLQRGSVMQRLAGHSDAMKFVIRKLADAEARGLSAAGQENVKRAFAEAFRKVPLETLDEMKDEAFEDLAGRFFEEVADNLSGHTLGGGQGNLAALLIGAVRGTRVDLHSVSYNPAATSANAELAETINTARGQGYVVQQLGRGYYSFYNPQTAETLTLVPQVSDGLGALQLPQAGASAGANTGANAGESPVAPVLREASYQQALAGFTVRLEEIRSENPSGWKTGATELLAAESEALLEAARSQLTESEVTFEEVRNANGELTALRILPEPGGSELNLYAQRQKRARDVSLVYDPMMLARHRAGALFDAEQRVILLSHDTIAQGLVDEQVYHEKIHSVLESVRGRGGNSLFFGSFSGPSAAFSLDEFATYSELLARRVNALRDPALGAEERSRLTREAVVHVRELEALVRNTSAVASALDVESIAEQVTLGTEARVNAEGEQRTCLLGALDSENGRIEFDLENFQRGEATKLTAEEARSLFADRLADLSRLGSELTPGLRALSAALSRSGASDKVPDAAVATQAAEIRSLVSERYLLDSAVRKTGSVRPLQPLGEFPSAAHSHTAPELRLAATAEMGRDPSAEIGIRSGFLDSVIDTTQEQMAALDQLPAVTEYKLVNSDEAFSIEVSDTSLVMVFDNGTREEIALASPLTGAQESLLIGNLRRKAENYGRRISGTKDRLKGAVQTARLTAAFYQGDASPREAATALQTLLGRTAFPAKVEVSEGQTQRQRLDALLALDGMDRDIDFIIENIESIREEMKKDHSDRLQGYGRAALDQIFEAAEAGAPRADLFDMLQEAERRRASRGDPVTLRLLGDRLVDENGRMSDYTFSMERTSSGRLAIQQLSPLSARGRLITPESLHTLVQQLEASVTYEGQRPLWTSPLEVSAEPFSALPPSRPDRFRASTELSAEAPEGPARRTLSFIGSGLEDFSDLKELLEEEVPGDTPEQVYGYTRNISTEQLAELSPAIRDKIQASFIIKSAFGDAAAEITPERARGIVALLEEGADPAALENFVVREGLEALRVFEEIDSLRRNISMVPVFEHFPSGAHNNSISAADLQKIVKALEIANGLERKLRSLGYSDVERETVEKRLFRLLTNEEIRLTGQETESIIDNYGKHGVTALLICNRLLEHGFSKFIRKQLKVLRTVDPANPSANARALAAQNELIRIFRLHLLKVEKGDLPTGRQINDSNYGDGTELWTKRFAVFGGRKAFLAEDAFEYFAAKYGLPVPEGEQREGLEQNVDIVIRSEPQDSWTDDPGTAWMPVQIKSKAEGAYTESLQRDLQRPDGEVTPIIYERLVGSHGHIDEVLETLASELVFPIGSGQYEDAMLEAIRDAGPAVRMRTEMPIWFEAFVMKDSDAEARFMTTYRENLKTKPGLQKDKTPQ